MRVRDGIKKSLTGTAQMSRQVTPRELGEKRDDPVRSLLVLRAWVLWRVHRDGWASARPCRQIHYAEHAALLERDVKSLKAPCGLLGDSVANNAFLELVPDIVVRLHATSGEAASRRATGRRATGGVSVCT